MHIRALSTRRFAYRPASLGRPSQVFDDERFKNALPGDCVDPPLARVMPGVRSAAITHTLIHSPGEYFPESLEMNHLGTVAAV